MGQITREFIERMLEHGNCNEHSPLTINEEQQLARAWARADIADEAENILKEITHHLVHLVLPSVPSPLCQLELYRYATELHVAMTTLGQKANSILAKYDELKDR